MLTYYACFVVVLRTKRDFQRRPFPFYNRVAIAIIVDSSLALINIIYFCPPFRTLTHHRNSQRREKERNIRQIRIGGCRTRRRTIGGRWRRLVQHVFRRRRPWTQCWASQGTQSESSLEGVFGRFVQWKDCQASHQPKGPCGRLARVYSMRRPRSGHGNATNWARNDYPNAAPMQ